MDPGNFKVKGGLKEIRAMFLFLSLSYTFHLLATGFYIRDMCVCICVQTFSSVILEYLLYTKYYHDTKQIKVRIVALVSFLMELIIDCDLWEICWYICSE